LTVGGRPAFLALGNEDPAPGGWVQVWYSGQKEALKFQNGRLVGAAGLPAEWRNVKLLNPPPWQNIGRTPITWKRLRDVMPGYRYGVEDELSIQRIEPPRRSALQRMDPAALVWFEERQSSKVRDMELPPARYGVNLDGGKAEVVYGEQCISKDLCFTWQLWPLTGQK
jgi:hypothetical protein